MSNNETDFEHLDPFHNASRRASALSEVLCQKVGEVHRRIKDPEQRYRVGDEEVSELTYGEIVHRVPTDDISNLPDGANRCSDAVVELILQETHIAAINYQLNEYPCPPSDFDTLGGFPAVSLTWVDKKLSIERKVDISVEGYKWHRVYRVDISEADKAIILNPWSHAYEAGGAPFPVMYTIGNPDSEDLQRIAFDFGMRAGAGVMA